MVYVINLKHRTDRWNHISAMLDSLGIKYTRWDASYSKDVRCSRSQLRGIHHFGAIGCRESHVRVAKDALEKNYKTFAVFEDDAILTVRTPRELHDVCAYWRHYASPDWDLFYLGANSQHEGKIQNVILITKQVMCTHAYLCTSKMAKIIAADAVDSGEPIDTFFHRVHIKNNRSYTVIKSLFGQMASYSDIDAKMISGRLYGKQ